MITTISNDNDNWVTVGAPFMGAQYTGKPEEFEKPKVIRNRVTTRVTPTVIC